MSQPSTARRYAFDTVFDADGAIVSEGAAAPMYSADDLARERAAGFEEGRSSETARAEALAAVALASIAESCARLTDRSLEERRALMRDAGGLALAAARKAAGAALVAFGEDRIVAAFDAAFETFIQTPRIVVRVAPGMESVRDRLEGAARDHGFAGALIVRADATHAAGDVSIDWGEGAVSLSAAEAFARIEAIVADALSSQQHSEDIP